METAAGVGLGALGVGVETADGMGVAAGLGEVASFGVGVALGVAVGLAFGVGVAFGATVAVGLAFGVGLTLGVGVAPAFPGVAFGEAAGFGVGVAFSVWSMPKILRKKPKKPPDFCFAAGVGLAVAAFTGTARRIGISLFSGRAVWTCWGVVAEEASPGVTVIWAKAEVAQKANTMENLFMGWRKLPITEYLPRSKSSITPFRLTISPQKQMS